MSCLGIGLHYGSLQDTMIERVRYIRKYEHRLVVTFWGSWKVDASPT